MRPMLSRLAVITLLLIALPMTMAAAPTSTTARSADAARPPDGAIERTELRHLTEDDLYRSPTGEVEAGTLVRLRLRAAAGDLVGAQAFFRDWASGESWLVEMESVAVEGQGNGDRYEYWHAEVETRPFPMILDYGFVARDGAVTCWLFGEGGSDSDGANRDEPWQQVGWRLTFNHPDIELPAQADLGDLEEVYRDGHGIDDASSCLLHELGDPPGAGSSP